MKKLLVSLSALLVFTFFNECFAQDAVDDAQFAIGKPAYAKMVRELWKDFDDNNFDRHDYMADTVIMMFPDGTVSKGKVANLAEVKKYRGSLKSVKSTIFACVSLTHPVRKEEAVCIWGQEEDTTADGKIEKKDLHEVWWFNKDGKVSRMMQWTAKFAE